MSRQQAQTVHVVGHFLDENESWWPELCDAGDHADDEYRCPEGDVPTAVWDRWRAALNEWNESLAAVVEAANFDRIHNMPCCDKTEFARHRHPVFGHILYPPSPDGDVWPAGGRPVTLATAAGADLVLDLRTQFDKLPVTFLYTEGHRLHEIVGERCYFEQIPSREMWMSCDHCGNLDSVHPNYPKPETTDG